MHPSDESKLEEELTDRDRAERGLRILGRIIARRLIKNSLDNHPLTLTPGKEDLPQKDNL